MSEPVPGTTFRYGGAAGRRSVITRTLRRTGYASYAQLGDELGVSDRTIRRDLADLAGKDVVRLVAGGAALPAGSVVGLDPLTDTAATRGLADLRTARRLAAAAAGLIEDRSAIALDGGLLAPLVAECLPELNLTVITPSLDAMYLLAARNGTALIGVGGSYDRGQRAFLGPSARETIAELRAGVVFVFSTGVDAEASYGNSQQAVEISQALLKIADRKVLVCESQAFGTRAPVFLADLSAFDTVVTDRGLGRGFRAVLEARSVELIVV